MDLVDGVVALLQTGTPSSPFTIEWKDDPSIELSDQALLTTQVWAVDMAHCLIPAFESTVAAGRGCPMEEFEVLLVIQRKIAKDANQPVVVRQLSLLVSELAAVCRANVVEDATCVKTQRKPARNLKDYHDQDKFYAEILTTWHRAA